MTIPNKAITDKLRFISLKYLHNTLWLILENIVRLASGFVVVLYLTRYLGPEKYGILSYSQSLVAIGAALATLGIDVVLVRELVNRKYNSGRLLGTACVLKFISAIVSIIIIYLFAILFNNDEAELLIIIVSASIIFNVSNTFDAYFQAKILSKKSAIAKTFAIFTSSVTKIVFIYNGAELYTFAYLIVMDSALIAVGYFFIILKENNNIDELRYDKKIAWYLMTSSWPLMIVTVSVLLYTRIDQIMIKKLIGSESVGYYAVAVNISSMLNFVPLMVAQSVFPKMVSIRRLGTEAEYLKFLGIVFQITAFVSMAIALFIYFFSGIVISNLFGVAYESSISILKILGLSVVFVGIGAVTTKIMYAESYETKYMWRSVAGVVINVLLNYCFIPLWGAEGAAIATISTLFFLCYVFDVFDGSLRKYYLLKVKCFLPIVWR